MAESRNFWDGKENLGVWPLFCEVPGAEEQALKVLEESAELLEAVKTKETAEVLAEMCDVLQAVANFMGCVGVDPFTFECAKWDCIAKNFERGRL